MQEKEGSKFIFFADILYRLYLAHEKLADSDPDMIPYKVMNRMLITIYGIITGSLSANYSYARDNMNKRL